MVGAGAAPTSYPPSFLPTAPRQDWALKSILPPFVLACFAAALLLAFALWRLLKLATCVRCIRGPRHRSKAAADILAARTHRWLQVIVALLACGMVAGAGYGFSTIHPTLESRGVGVYEQAKVRQPMALGKGAWWVPVERQLSPPGAACLACS